MSDMTWVRICNMQNVLFSIHNDNELLIRQDWLGAEEKYTGG
jgi:hypothetical protein